MTQISLLLDMLREDQLSLTEAEIAGAWWMLTDLTDCAYNGCGPDVPSVAIHALDAGILEVALAELRRAARGRCEPLLQRNLHQPRGRVVRAVAMVLVAHPI